MAKRDTTEATPPPATQTAPAALVIPERVMYLGPSIAENGKLFPHGQIFNRGVSIEWLEKAGADVNFRRLLVPLEQVPKAVAELAQPGSMLHAANKAILDGYKARVAKARKGK